MVLNGNLVIDLGGLNLVVDCAHILLLTVDHYEYLPGIPAIFGYPTVARTAEGLGVHVAGQSRALGLLIERFDNYVISVAVIEELSEPATFPLLRDREP